MIRTSFFYRKNETSFIMKPRTSSSNRKSILYHLHVLDEQSESSVDLSEYPC